MEKCKYCNKEFKTKRGMELHINKYCKNKTGDVEELVDTINNSNTELKDKKPQEVIDIMIKDIVLEQKEMTIEDELIDFFRNANLENIYMKGDKLDLFFSVWKKYFNSPLTKTCNSGICHAYSQLYYITQKIIKDRNEN